MDRSQMNHSGCRPYRYTCGMNPGTASGGARSSSDMQNINRQNSGSSKTQIPAMAYVPVQEFEPTFELCKALQVGTIFPGLCKPFCGRRGGCR